MNINIISRGKGHSACAAAAYRAGELIKSEYDGITHDYTKKRGIAYTEIMLPENAPAEFYERSTLWNSIERIEKNANAQLAREVRLALPKELTHEQNIALVREYVNQNFVSRGMCADICLHDKSGINPHAHILLSMRPLENNGTWGAKSKMEYILNDNGERIKLPSGRYKTKKITATDWNDRANAENWREAWADSMNRHLENNGFDIRVDHRSYERQGKEQIPTVHLGSVAHGLEQQGIETERGNINRAIKAANEKLRKLDNDIQQVKNEKSELQTQLSEILDPPKPPKLRLIIDLENSIKAQNSPGYAHWCRIFNLQQAAQTLLYIQNNRFADMKSLQTAQQTAYNDHANIGTLLKENRADMKVLTIQKRQTEIYRNTREVYQKYRQPWQIGYFKNQFYEMHKADIEAHKKAKAYIFNEAKLEKLPSLKRLSNEIAELKAQESILQKDLKAAHKKLSAVSVAEHNARLVLGYKKLEITGYSPSIPRVESLRSLKPYKLPFSTAQKREETAQYFNSLHLDIVCANDIRSRLDEGRGESSTADAIIAKYGKERAEWVMAAFGKNNAATQSTQAFQYSPPESFIQAFREKADSMVFSDDFGWEFPYEIAERERQSVVINRDTKSFSAQLAAAERKAREQDRNSHAPKKRRGYDHELG